MTALLKIKNTIDRKFYQLKNVNIREAIKLVRNHLATF